MKSPLLMRGPLGSNEHRNAEGGGGEGHSLLRYTIGGTHYVMRPLRYSINVTLDGCCDHRAMVADEDLHRHAVENLAQADALLFGRVTYEMMKGVTEVLCYGTAVRVEPLEL